MTDVHESGPTESAIALLDVAAHEVRAPIAALNALAGAYSAAEAPETRQRILALAIQAGRDIERILSHPVGLVEDATVELGGVLAGLVERWQHECPQGPAVRLVGVAQGAESLGSDLNVAIGETGLRQIVQNLLANAARHASSVELALRPGTDVVVLDVTDDGPGVPPGLDPFARGVSGEGSSGIGLWLSRSIAEAAGGSLELIPSASGAHFRLTMLRLGRRG